MKKLPEQNPVGVFAILILLLSLAVVFLVSGCYTKRKATKEIIRASVEYPEVAASILRQRWPCDTTSVDSSGFKKSMEEANEYIRILDSIIETNIYKSDRFEIVADSLRRELSELDSVSVCDSIFEPLYRECSSIKKENDALKKAGKKAESVINRLRKQISEFRPVVQTVEDEAEVYLAQKRMYEWKHDYIVVKSKRDLWRKIALISLAINLVLILIISKTKRK